MEKEELRSQHFEWQTQWLAAFICTAQLRSSVCSDATPSPHSSLSPSLLAWGEVLTLILAYRDILQSATQSLRQTHLSEPLYFTAFLSFHGHFPWAQDKSIKVECKSCSSCSFSSLNLYRPGQTYLQTEFTCTSTGLCSFRPVSQGDVQVLVHWRELPFSHQPRQFCPGLTIASIAAGIGSKNWLSPKTCKSYYTPA